MGEDLGLNTIGLMAIPKEQTRAPPHQALSPIRKAATGKDVARIEKTVATGPSMYPTPVQKFADGICNQTYLMAMEKNHQVLEDVDLAEQKFVDEVEDLELAPPSPACAEYINPGSPSTASESLLKYISTIAYQAGDPME